MVDQGDPDGTGLRRDGQRSRFGPGPPEPRGEPDLRVGGQDAEAVGTDQSHVVPSGGGQHLALQCRAVGTRLAQPRREHHRSSDSGGAALPDDRQHLGGGDGDDGKVHRCRDVTDRVVRREAGDFEGVRVDGVHGAGEAALDDAPEDLVPDVVGPTAGTDHCDAAGREQRGERGAFGVRLTFVHEHQGAVVEGRVQHGPRHALFGPALGVQARGPEDVEHPAVLRQGVGDQPADPAPFRPCPQLLEEQHADATTLLVVRDQQRDLRHVAAGAVPPGHRHDQTADLGDQRVVVLVAVPRECPQVLGRRVAVHGEEAEVHRPVAEPGGEPTEPFLVGRGDRTHADDMTVAGQALPARRFLARRARAHAARLTAAATVREGRTARRRRDGRQVLRVGDGRGARFGT